MADKSSPLILDALRRAAAAPDGLPLFHAKTVSGLFPGSAAGRQAAQSCKDAGYLRVLRTETRGKTVQETCALTEKGLAHLLAEGSPRPVLEELLRVLDQRRGDIADLLGGVRQTQQSFEALRALADKALRQPSQPAPASNNASESWPAAVLALLTRRHEQDALQDCPLPELYRQALQAAPGLSIGQFHDGLRRLLEREQIYLHPWSGPLHDLPEPALALLAGHEVTYYASVRRGAA